MDEKISDLFQEWLSAFDAVQVASGEEAIARAHSRLTEIETQIANTQGEGMQCLAIKLGLHCFLADQADAPSLQSESAYRDLESLSFEASWARGARFPSVGDTTLMCGSFNQPNKFPSFSPKDQIEEVRKLLRRVRACEQSPGALVFRVALSSPPPIIASLHMKPETG